MKLKKLENYTQYVDLQNSRSGMPLDNNAIFTRIHLVENELDKSMNILDLGCRGHAIVLRTFYEQGYTNVYGIDIGRNAELQWQKLPFVQNMKRHDAHDSLPFDVSFELISMSHVLEHCHDPYRVLNNVKEKLVDHGLLWSVVPTESEAQMLKHNPHYVAFENHDNHIKFIEDQGFTVVFDEYTMGKHQPESRIWAQKS